MTGPVDCEHVHLRVYEYLDGELTEERRIEISVHLDECAPCLGAFDFEAELRTVIASRCKDHVPEALRQRVHDALLEEERRQASGH